MIFGCLSAFYDQLSVAEPGPTPGPWSIYGPNRTAYPAGGLGLVQAAASERWPQKDLKFKKSSFHTFLLVPSFLGTPEEGEQQ